MNPFHSGGTVKAFLSQGWRHNRLLVRVVIALVVLAALALIFALCSRHSAKSEREILSDIRAYDDYYSNFNLNIDSIQITKRQTNPEQKVDYVWCTVSASNRDFTCSRDYSLTYILYNDGWLLDDYDERLSSLLPKSYPSEDDARSCFSFLYDDYDFIGEVERDDFLVSYQATWQEEDQYIISTYETTLDFVFSPGSGWETETSTREIAHSLDILGTWLYEDEERYYSVDIISLDNNWKEDDLWWGCKSTSVTLSYHIEGKDYCYDSNGAVQWELSENSVKYGITDSSNFWWSFSSDGLPHKIALYAGKGTVHGTGEAGLFYCEMWTATGDYNFNLIRQ